MHQQLLAKRSDYLPVAEHGALLFSVISELFRLHPYYHFRLETFLRLCHHTITDRCSGKKFSGSPAARAAELVDALTKNVYSRISWSLFLGKGIAIFLGRGGAEEKILRKKFDPNFLEQKKFNPLFLVTPSFSL